MGGLYDWIRGIILLYLWKQKSPNIYRYLKSNLLQNEKFASLNVHLHTSFEQNVLQIGRYHARSKFIF